MALIACGECGRAVSDKAIVCVGCGAPLPTSSPIDLIPSRSVAPPPTRAQIKRRALISLAMLTVGIVLAGFLDHKPGSRLGLFVATLLIIGGLCWLILALIHAVASRR